jgi:hypothetical protein
MRISMCTGRLFVGLTHHTKMNVNGGYDDITQLEVYDKDHDHVILDGTHEQIVEFGIKIIERAAEKLSQLTPERTKVITDFTVSLQNLVQRAKAEE